MALNITTMQTVDDVNEGEMLALCFALAELLIKTYPDLKDEIITAMEGWQMECFWHGADLLTARQNALTKLRGL